MNSKSFAILSFTFTQSNFIITTDVLTFFFRVPLFDGSLQSNILEDIGRTYSLRFPLPQWYRLPFQCNIMFTASGHDHGDLVQGDNNQTIHFLSHPFPRGRFFPIYKNNAKKSAHVQGTYATEEASSIVSVANWFCSLRILSLG